MEVATDAGLLNCDSCELRRLMLEMDSTNRDAWTRYRQLTGHRLVFDAHAGAWWLAHVTRDVDPDDLEDVMARFRVLYDTFCPPKTE